MHRSPSLRHAVEDLRGRALLYEYVRRLSRVLLRDGHVVHDEGQLCAPRRLQIRNQALITLPRLSEGPYNRDGIRPDIILGDGLSRAGKHIVTIAIPIVLATKQRRRLIRVAAIEGRGA